MWMVHIVLTINVHSQGKICDSLPEMLVKKDNINFILHVNDATHWIGSQKV